MSVEDVFKFKKFNTAELIAYGFVREGAAYVLERAITDGQFTLCVRIEVQSITADVIEVDSGERFLPYYVSGAQGAFVGGVRAEVEAVLNDIAAHCCETQIFKERQTAAVIAFALEEYGTLPEYLWVKFPDNAVLRRADNNKWYAAILTTGGEKFGRQGNAEVIDLRGDPEYIDGLVDDINYFRGYHMNKKHWYTIVLDGCVPDLELFERIRASYLLAKK